jgi:hypothetical protein
MSIAYQGNSRFGETTPKTRTASISKAIVEAYRQHMKDAGHTMRWKERDTVTHGKVGNDTTLIAAVLAKGGYSNAIDGWACYFAETVTKSMNDVEEMPTKICDIQKNASAFPRSICAVVEASSCTTAGFWT